MKKILLIVAIISIAVPALAVEPIDFTKQYAMIVSGRPAPGGAAACTTTCESGATCEGFNGTSACGDGSNSNCDLANWTVSGTINLAATCPGTPPAGVCAKCIYWNAWSSIGRSLGGTYTSFSVKFYVYLHEHAAWNGVCLLQTRDQDNVSNSIVSIWWDSENSNKLRYRGLGAGGTEVLSSSAVTPDTWNLVECKATKASTSYCRLNGEDEKSFNGGNFDATQIVVAGQMGGGTNSAYIGPVRWKVGVAEYF